MVIYGTIALTIIGMIGLYMFKKIKLTSRFRWLIYTSLWIGFMLVFEYITVIWDIVVFTGWIMWPWSTVTYIVVFLLDTLLYLWMKPEIRTTINEKG
ncbi:MAG: hypothetical protein H7X86_04830 [Gorillibacterium sp.]|nr:hypothetical protein [Gorillibacterium sp.]